MRLFTITLDMRTWHATDVSEAISFIHSFGNDSGFKMKSKPYTGDAIEGVQAC